LENYSCFGVPGFYRCSSDNRSARIRNGTGDGSAALASLDAAAREGRNLMPLIVECVRQNCTVGEIVSKLKETFGEHKDQGF